MRLYQTPAETEHHAGFDDLKRPAEAIPSWLMYTDITAGNVESIPGKWLTEAYDLLTAAIGNAAIDTYVDGPSQETLTLASSWLVAGCELVKRTQPEPNSFDENTWFAENWRSLARRIDNQLFSGPYASLREATDVPDDALEDFFGPSSLE